MFYSCYVNLCMCSSRSFGASESSWDERDMEEQRAEGASRSILMLCNCVTVLVLNSYSSHAVFLRDSAHSAQRTEEKPFSNAKYFFPPQTSKLPKKKKKKKKKKRKKKKNKGAADDGGGKKKRIVLKVL